MSSTNSVEGMQETRAQAYARALEAWANGYGNGGAPGRHARFMPPSFCKEIASERFAAWRAELRAERFARQSMRIARTESDLEQMLVHTRRDEQAILATRAASAIWPTRWRTTGGRAHSIGRGQGREADPSEPPTASAGGHGACDQP